jgi:hypothetical protein
LEPVSKLLSALKTAERSQGLSVISRPHRISCEENVRLARRLLGLSFITLGIPILVKRLPFAKPAPIRGIHLQQADRRSAYRGAPDNKDSVALEVLLNRPA